MMIYDQNRDVYNSKYPTHIFFFSVLCFLFGIYKEISMTVALTNSNKYHCVLFVIEKFI